MMSDDDDKIPHTEPTPTEVKPVAPEVTDPVVNNLITEPDTEAVQENEIPTEEFGRSGIDTVDDAESPSMGEALFNTRVAELAEALTKNAGQVAADRLAWTPTVVEVLRRANSVETSLLILLEILNIEVPYSQIQMETRSVASMKLRIVGHGSYKTEHLLHAVMLGKVNIERMQRELTDEKRQVVDANRTIDQQAAKITQLQNDIATLRSVPPPPVLDKRHFVLCYRDSKGRLNYLHCDEAGVYHRTRRLGKAMRFTSQVAATMTLLDVLNHPARNAFPKAYLLQFHSLHLINHSVSNLSGAMASRVGEAIRHVQQYEAERQQPKTPRKKSTRTRTREEKEKPVERRRNRRGDSPTNKNRNRRNK
jgi:hypothetical protein